jgi:hypothetical protein
MLMYDAIDCSFRSVKLRTKDPNCVVCGAHPTTTQLIDYEQFCQSTATDKVSQQIV